MRLDPSVGRERDVARVRSKLLRDGYPRLQMACTAGCKGSTGATASIAPCAAPFGLSC